MTSSQRWALAIHVVLIGAVLLIPGRLILGLLLAGFGDGVDEDPLISPVLAAVFAFSSLTPYLLMAGFVALATWRWARGFGKGLLFVADLVTIVGLLFAMGGFVVLLTLTTSGASALETWWPELLAIAMAVVAAGFASGVPPPTKRVA